MCSIDLFEYLCDSYAVQIRHHLSWTSNWFKNERINSQYIVLSCVFSCLSFNLDVNMDNLCRCLTSKYIIAVTVMKVLIQ